MEVIIHFFSVAAVKLTDKNANEDILIAENGKIPVKADPLIKRALDRFVKDNNKQQSGRWHFTVGKDIKDHCEGSKVIKRLKHERSKLYFFDK